MGVNWGSRGQKLSVERMAQTGGSSNEDQACLTARKIWAERLIQQFRHMYLLLTQNFDNRNVGEYKSAIKCLRSWIRMCHS
jgi:hypothetical protein